MFSCVRLLPGCLSRFTVGFQLTKSRSHRRLHRAGTSLIPKVAHVYSRSFAAIHSTPRWVSPAVQFITPIQAQRHDGLITIPGIQSIPRDFMGSEMERIRLRQKHAGLCYRRLQDEHTDCYHLRWDYTAGCQAR